MGNRCVITTRQNWRSGGIGIYLHWNGGRDSVEAFLKYCEIRGFMSPSEDNYGWAQLSRVIGNFLGDSVGIDTMWHLDVDNGDNGVYIIEGWKIIDRKHFDGLEQQSYDPDDMLLSIDEAQPKEEQLRDFLLAEPVEMKDLQVGDTVCFINWQGRVVVSTVAGFGDDSWVNGSRRDGIPYVDLCCRDNPKSNPNNYLDGYEVRRIKKEEN